MFKSIGKLFLLKPGSLTSEEREFYKDLSFENFIFFRDHFKEDFRAYLSELSKAQKNLKFLAVDQEGGRVVRIEGDFESPLEIGKRAKIEGLSVVKEWALKIASAIKNYQLNLNLAPVIDRADEEAPDFLKGRTFGLDPNEIIKCSEIFIEAHQQLNIRVCLKHFPGLFGVVLDPHRELPLKEDLLEEDLFPFKALAENADFIMTTHLFLPKLDSKPVTFSEKAISFLRKETGFRGAVLTDDLSMGALKAYELSERIIYALLAGHNLLIYCGDLKELEKTLFEIKEEVEKSSILKEKIKTTFSILERY